MIENSSPPPSPSPRAAYAPPKLVVYGTLPEMTQVVGKHSANDGGTGMTNMSGV